ncbi:MAG: hydantoinase/oxoprolinase family protein [Acidobacteria bacterium]|nr:hydantoinase/oxoprolinase family protein [Acidobacteriota bacterium]
MMKKTKITRSANAHSLRIGVDTGGTFTDFIAVFKDHQLTFKIPSTPRAPEQAILDGLIELTRAFDEIDGESDASRVAMDIVHGTTVATNALLERKGARTALVTTAGFEDVIEIGRQARPDLYNLSVTRPDPLVPRELRFGLKERITADGGVIVPLKQTELAWLREKLKRAKVESIAVSLLFSFADPSHERAVSEALEALNIPVSISNQILPEYREYERTSTVVINAYLAPVVSRYLSGLTHALSRHASKRGGSRLRIMQSSGGSISAQVAAREPVRTILSGPAGGVVAAMQTAELADAGDIITFDMGGTSTDVALCRGAARTTNEAQIAGLPVAVPILDIHTVGAGGGSIAHVDAGGALRVGPQSAGADPGPACYGKGTRPTVTDANLALGRFAGGGLLSGQIKLDEERAAAVIDELAAEMSRASSERVTRVQAALGVIRVANSNMERALRLVSVERGHDPRFFTLVSFGGAGGLHAAALAGGLRIPRVLIPAHPGAFSALGLLLADVIKDYSRTVMTSIENSHGHPREIERQLAALEKRAIRDLRAEGFAPSRMNLSRTMAMRYRGQSFELEIEASGDCLAKFHQAHLERYGHADPQRTVEIVSVRLRGAGITEKPELKRAGRVQRSEAQPQRSALVWLGEKRVPVSVYDRAGLKPGAMIDTPAIIIEYGSTTLVPAGWRASVDRWRNLRLDFREEIKRQKAKGKRQK